MIKNIVFDLGRVLIGFDPENYLDSFGFDKETVQTLEQMVFGAQWKKYDRGDHPDVFSLRDALIRENPAYETEIRMALHPEWVKIHIRKEDSIAYLYELKSRGYRIYILSNLAKESYEYVRGFEFFREIDGGVFSYQERVIKPDEKIYRILLDRYALKPEETLFFDDVPENIEAARRLGIHGIVFTDLSAAKTQAEQFLNP